MKSDVTTITDFIDILSVRHLLFLLQFPLSGLLFIKKENLEFSELAKLLKQIQRAEKERDRRANIDWPMKRNED